MTFSGDYTAWDEYTIVIELWHICLYNVTYLLHYQWRTRVPWHFCKHLKCGEISCDIADHVHVRLHLRIRGPFHERVFHCTVYPKKYAHGFAVLCFVVVMQSFIMSSHEVFIHIHQGCFAGTGAIVRLPQCQWSKPDGYGKISQCITTAKHSKAKTVCIFLGIYCSSNSTEILFCSHPSYRKVIAMKLCTLNESCTVVAYAKFRSVITPYNGIALIPIFHRISITMEIVCEIAPPPPPNTDRTMVTIT